MSTPAADEGLWVRSDVMPDGTYAVTITVDADRTWVLDRRGAQRYATTAVEAAQRAEYDAAIFRLLTRRLGMNPGTAAEVIGKDLRPDRPALDDVATSPLTFTPGVNTQSEPFLAVSVDGDPWGQLSPDELRAHAMVVLEAPAAADLDAGLLRFLLGAGVAETAARAAVGDLANWRAVWTCTCGYQNVGPICTHCGACS